MWEDLVIFAGQEHSLVRFLQLVTRIFAERLTVRQIKPLEVFTNEGIGRKEKFLESSMPR